MEQWLKEAKDTARNMAEEMVNEIRLAATEADLEPDWFLEEVVKNIHRIKNP
jgi:hypothetical protein